MKKKFDYWLYYRKLCIAFIAWFVGGRCAERCVRPGLWAGEGVSYQWTAADVQKEGHAARGARALEGRRPKCNKVVECEKVVERVNLVMKTRKMRHLKKALVAGLAAFMMLAESVTAFACPADGHDEGCTCSEEHGTVILYDEQFVDEDGNISPVSGINPRGFCFKHEIVSGYYQTHVKNSSGGCTVKTYYSTQCIYCNTIWLGDLYAVEEHAKCPHANVK